MAKPKLRILRGIHTSSQVESLAAELQDADIVCLESLGSVSLAKDTFMVMNALSTSREYIDHFQSNVKQDATLSFGVHLAWALRGRGKRFYQVDYVWEDTAPAEEYQRRMPMLAFEGALQKISVDPASRYQIMNEWLTHEIEAVRWRDRLVTSQLKRLLEKDDGSVWRDVYEANGGCTIALCVGFLHNPMPLLQQQLADFDITETMYDEDGVKKMMRADTILQLLWNKKRNPGQTLSNKEIDYGLYGLMLRSSLDTAEAEEQTSIEENIIRGIDRGAENDAAIQRLEAASQLLKPISDYEAEELSQLVEKLLSEG